MKLLDLQTNAFLLLQEGFREWLLTNNYSDSAVKYYPLHAREFLFFLESNKITSMKKAKPEHVTEFMSIVSRRTNQVTQSGALSGNYIDHIGVSVIAFLNYLWLTKDIAIDVELAKAESQQLLPTVLTVSEVKLLFDSLDNEFNPIDQRNKAILAVLYGAGLRRTEMYMLDVEDISIVESTIHVRHGKGNKERVVPVPRRLMNYIITFISGTRDLLARIAIESESALFIDINGRRINKDYYYNILSDILSNCQEESIQKKHVHLHTFRHSIATHMMEAGMDIERVAQFLGHSSLDSTMIYTHLAEEQREENE
jgi:integrase/recombinase XerD